MMMMIIFIFIIVIIIVIVIIVTTYIEELDRCVRVKASRARFAFHRSPTPGNCDGNDDNGDDDESTKVKFPKVWALLKVVHSSKHPPATNCSDDDSNDIYDVSGAASAAATDDDDADDDDDDDDNDDDDDDYDYQSNNSQRSDNLFLTFRLFQCFLNFSFLYGVQ